MFEFVVASVPEWLAILGTAVGMSLLAIVVVTAPVVLVTRGRPRIDLAIEDGTMIARLGKRDAAFAFRRRVSIPLAQISGVATAARTSVPRHGLRLPGTEIPGFILTRRPRPRGYGRSWIAEPADATVRPWTQTWW